MKLGAAVFVAGSYWYLYLRDDEKGEASAGGVRETPTSASTSRPAA